MIALLCSLAFADPQGFVMGVSGGGGANSMAREGAVDGTFSLRLGHSINDRSWAGIDLGGLGQFVAYAPERHVGTFVSFVGATGGFYPTDGPQHLDASVGWSSGVALDRQADLEGFPVVTAIGGQGVGLILAAGTHTDTDGLNIGGRLRADVHYVPSLPVGAGLGIELNLFSY